MVNVGRVIPIYTPIGKLKGRLGSHHLTPKGKGSLPLGLAQYSPLTNPQVSFSWQRINEAKDLEVSPDSILQLDDSILHALITPKHPEPGALLVQKDQLTPEVRETLAKMVRAAGKDLDQYASSIILLPFLEVDGKSAACFDLAMTGTDQAEVEDFVADTINEFITQLRQSGNKTLFINPYYQSRGFLGSQRS